MVRFGCLKRFSTQLIFGACTESELRFVMLSRCAALFPGDFKSGMGVRASSEADPKGGDSLTKQHIRKLLRPFQELFGKTSNSTAFRGVKLQKIIFFRASLTMPHKSISFWCTVFFVLESRLQPSSPIFGGKFCIRSLQSLQVPGIGYLLSLFSL